MTSTAPLSEKDFEKQVIQRGSIIRRSVTLISRDSRGSPKAAFKRFLIVSNDCSVERLFGLMMPSSRMDRFESYPDTCVFIPPGTLPSFERKAAVDCRTAYTLGRPELYREYQFGKLDHLDYLPKELLGQVGPQARACGEIAEWILDLIC